MELPTAKDLFDAGVHIGHQMRRWNPKFRPYLYANRYGISIIDLEKTLIQLEKACYFLEQSVTGGKDIWLLGTKPQARDVIRAVADETAMPYCLVRWLGGTVTNFSTINEGLGKYRKFLAMEQRGDIERMPNKEASSLRRKMRRMKNNFEGLINIDRPPSVIFAVDSGHEAIAVREAHRAGIPVVAIVDTNSDPSLVDYPIPANDDSVRSLQIIVRVVGDAIRRGLEGREQRQAGKLSSLPLEERGSIELEPQFTLSEDAQTVLATLEEQQKETDV
ncbi:MAG: 30S ribosomal protein S2 [Puniceicoccales bacterium]|jgi:small subunit ribosomal protein S2|nr:30S ribosomal protein S2 [Puniceicoccales bacterium]